VADLINIAATGQKYLITLAQIDGVDLTNIKEIVFVIKGAGVHQLKVDWCCRY